MNREWQELDPYNLPSDILKPGAWEFGIDPTRTAPPDPRYATKILSPSCPIVHVENAKNGTIRFCRRPEGWEPSECPTCRSDIKGLFKKGCNPMKGIYNSWHNQPKAPTHEEIMTKWWRLGVDAYSKPKWARVITYHDGTYVLISASFYFDGLREDKVTPIEMDKPAFLGLESADIPPEV